MKKLSSALGALLVVTLSLAIWLSQRPPSAPPTVALTAPTDPTAADPLPDLIRAVDPPTPRKIVPRSAQTTPARAGATHVPTSSDAPLAGSVPLVLPSDFLERIADVPSKRVNFALPDGSAATGTIELLRRDEQGILLVQGRLSAPAPGFYFFQRQTVPGVAGAFTGVVRFDQGDTAFRIDPAGPGGSPMLVAHRLDQVLCVNLEPPDPARLPAEEPQNAPQAHPINIPIPDYQNGVVPLQSLPGALAVIYLDFDGEKGPFSGWGDFDAAPSGATNAQVKEVWQRVAEDYQGFNINITTDRRVFDNAPQSSRQHCILTPTTDAAPGAGGVSYIGSFNNTGDTVNWAFYWTGKNGAEVVSHECGHALGLGHDGRTTPSEEYYGGQGSGETGWAPIMGVGYYQNLTQWSKGEYANPSNTQDDLSIITNNNNNVDFRTDDYGATLASAGYLEIQPDNSVSNEGILEQRTDVDAFRFTTSGGAVSLTASVVSAGPDVDLLAEIYDSANVLVASNNGDLVLNATVAANLAAGDYTLRVSGVGRGDPLVDGYSDYASNGAYLIGGTVANGVKPDRFTVAENSPNSTAVGTVAPRNSHGANPLIFSIASGNTGNAFAIDAATGAITVATPGQLNYETLSTRWDDPATFQLFVNVVDTVDSGLNETVRVVVTVTDVNEAPTITGGSVTILEHARPGTKVFKVTGNDVDRYEFPIFSIESGNTGNAFAIDSTSGQVTVAADLEATTQSVFTLTVRATDHGTPALTADATVTITLINVPNGYTPGAIVRTFYDGISGTNVSDLTGNANFPNNPTSQVTLTSFDSGTEHGDNYGDTIRGWLIPPTTGSYTFWIASDDSSELRISTNASPASATVRASVNGFTDPHQWTKFSSQASTAISLTAGTPYYIESRHKEGGGGDHVAVAWQGPGISQQVIGGAYLAQQTINTIRPSTTLVNIPGGLGLAIETNNAGRPGATFAWSKVSGPGTVTFDNAAALITGAAFSANGTYVLRCTESGAALPITLDLTVNRGVVDYGLVGEQIGPQLAAPSHTVSGGIYTINALGDGIPSSGTPDNFYFIHTPASGNVTITARVVSVQNVDGSNSRAGVMIREGLGADAREAFVGVTSQNGGRFIYRATAGSASANATASVTQPYWVRLIRTGTSFTAQIAADSGGNPGAFTAIGTPQTIPMSNDALVGLAATSGSATATGSIVIDKVTIAPTAVNVGPNVNAGADAAPVFPTTANLDGTVSDDGKPTTPGAVTTTWSKASGPGTVTFGDTSAIDTTADFSLPGAHVLRLAADDGAVKTFDSVTITPTTDTTVTVTATDANASEPGANTGTFTFTRTGSTSGALTVNFTLGGTANSSDYSALPTSVVIPDTQASTTLVVTPVDDASVEGAETVVITLAGGFYNIGGTGNATVTIADNDVVPSVNITSPTAANVNVPTGVGVILEATVSDDGLPNPLTLTWSKVSGPGTVTFAPANTANSAATFSVAGTYVLRLTANDGQFVGTDDVTVNFGTVDNKFTGTPVGAQAVTPNFTLTNGSYSISAAGNGIPSTGTPDDFYFLNTTVTGNVTITARCVSVQAINGSNSRAGVMIRNSLAADAVEAFCGINSAGSGRWIYRATAATNSANSQAAAGFPYWVRLIRSGSTFTAQFAPDSSGAPGTFTTAGTPQTLTMGSSVFVGLAATSGSTTTLGTAVFDKVSITPIPANVGANVNAGPNATITLPASASLNGTVTDDGKPGAFTTTWSKASGPGTVTFGNSALVDTTASFSIVGSYILRLVANDGEVKTFDDTNITVNLAPIDQWRQAHFGSNPAPGLAGNLDNPDGDLYVNLLEYALGLDPLVPGAGGVVVDLETVGADTFLRLTVTKNSAATDVNSAVEVTDDLTVPASWTTSGTTIEADTSTLLQVRDNTPLSAANQRYIRLKVTLP